MSELRATTISDTAGTGPVTLTGQSPAKAWIGYDQTGPTTDDSYNVSSITDSSTGDVTVNQTNNSAAANFTVQMSSDTVNPRVEYTNMTTSSWRALTYNTSNSLIDSQVFTSRFGDLA